MISCLGNTGVYSLLSESLSLLSCYFQLYYTSIEIQRHPTIQRLDFSRFKNLYFCFECYSYNVVSIIPDMENVFSALLVMLISSIIPLHKAENIVWFPWPCPCTSSFTHHRVCVCKSSRPQTLKFHSASHHLSLVSSFILVLCSESEPESRTSSTKSTDERFFHFWIFFSSYFFHLSFNLNISSAASFP